jgi:hypothetical protein
MTPTEALRRVRLLVSDPPKGDDRRQFETWLEAIRELVRKGLAGDNAARWRHGRPPKGNSIR